MAGYCRYTGVACEFATEFGYCKITGCVKRNGVRVVNDLYKLPAAQPEIIHCKDCKHSEHWYRDRRRCFLWNEDGVSVFDDGFCNYGERKERDGK